MSNNCDETKCNGDCASCGGDGVTVTLTLDDDSTVECAIVGIFDGGDNRLAGGGPKPHRIDHATDMREAMMFEG